LRTEIPFPPRPQERRGVRMEPPWVPVEPRWEYHELVRPANEGELPTEADLNALGAEHWELVGVMRAEGQAHFYFKRERAP
jgi:hypothetical protein